MARNDSGGVAAPRRRPRKPRNKTSHGGFQGGRSGTQNASDPQPLTFKAGQDVKGGVKQRALKRSKAVGKVKGVNTKDGITGREARKIKRAWNRDGRPSGNNGNGNANGGNAQQRNQGTPNDPFAEEVNALTRLQYGEQERQLESERRISGQQSANLNNWYGQYQNDVKAAEQRSQAGYAAAQQSIYAQATAAQAGDQAFQGQVAGQQAQQQQVTGAVADPALAQQAQQAAGARQALSNSFGGMIATQGASQNAFMANQQQVVGGQRVQALSNEQARARKIEELSRELLADKGAFKVQARTQLKDAKHKADLENQAFGLDVLQEENDVANENRDDRLARRKEKRERRQNRWDRKQDRAQNRLDRDKYQLDQRTEQRMRDQDLADDGRLNGSSGGSDDGGSRKYTQSQRNAAQKSFRTARRLASGINAGKGERSDAIDFLVDKGIDVLLARAAVVPGSLTDSQRRELQRMGIKVRAKKSGGSSGGHPSTGGGIGLGGSL